MIRLVFALGIVLIGPLTAFGNLGSFTPLNSEPTGICQGKDTPDLSLILSMDQSSSMSPEELNIQLTGYAAALEDNYRIA